MHHITLKNIKLLSEAKGENLVTLYLPTVVKGKETQQNRVRFKNLIQKTEAGLKERGFSPKKTGKFLKPAYKLLENTIFWGYQERGLAVFISADGFEYYRLPVEVPDTLYIGKRFNLKPVLKLYESNGRYAVLCLELEEPRVYLGDKYKVWPVDIEDQINGFTQILNEYNPQKSLQFRTGIQTDGAGRSATFHGHGSGKEKQKKYMAQYFRKLDKVLNNKLENKSHPLILIGLDHLVSIYREVSSYPNIEKEFVNVNPKELDEMLVHSKTWEIVQPRFIDDTKKIKEEYLKHSRSDLASCDVKDIVRSSFYGKTKYLCVCIGRQKWGNFDPESNKVELYAEAKTDSRELLNYSALQTIINSGKVYALEESEMPCDCEMAAVYRY